MRKYFVGVLTVLVPAHLLTSQSAGEYYVMVLLCHLSEWIADIEVRALGMHEKHQDTKAAADRPHHSTK